MNISHIVNVNDFVNWCDYLGTLAFAISGIRLAAGKGLDWFGAYVVGFVTAVGGGTIRDILLDIKPFWLIQPSYLIITGLGLLFTIVFRRQVVRLNHSLFFFDAINCNLLLKKPTIIPSVIFNPSFGNHKSRSAEVRAEYSSS